MQDQLEWTSGQRERGGTADEGADRQGEAPW